MVLLKLNKIYKKPVLVPPIRLTLIQTVVLYTSLSYGLVSGSVTCIEEGSATNSLHKGQATPIVIIPCSSAWLVLGTFWIQL